MLARRKLQARVLPEPLSSFGEPASLRKALEEEGSRQKLGSGAEFRRPRQAQLQNKTLG